MERYLLQMGRGEWAGDGSGKGTKTEMQGKKAPGVR